MISAPAVQFKGSGWYVTDYAKKSHTSSDSGSKDTKETKKDEKINGFADKNCRGMAAV